MSKFYSAGGLVALTLVISACGESLSGDQLNGSELQGARVSQSRCSVLVVMSSADTLAAVPNKIPFTSISLSAGGTKSFKFGFLLNEMAVPVMALVKHGCKVTYATPDGQIPVRDPQGDTPTYFTDGVRIPDAKARQDLKDALSLVTNPKESEVLSKGPGSFNEPLTLASLNNPAKLDAFDAIFIPGGYAAMLNLRSTGNTGPTPVPGLWEDKNLGSILRYFNSKSRLTVTLCRGGVSLASAANDQGWVYAGYKMTTYSTLEDNLASNLNKVLPTHQLPFHPNEKLKELGARLIFRNFQAHIVEDREVLMGQNQSSAHKLARRFVEKIKELGK